MKKNDNEPPSRATARQDGFYYIKGMNGTRMTRMTRINADKKKCNIASRKTAGRDRRRQAYSATGWTRIHVNIEKSDKEPPSPATARQDGFYYIKGKNGTQMTQINADKKK
ncbi:MAG: hypothetical protein GY859_20795 [Desulfobacterales bacterium]|nr:hypothetical protein [Desulfobacterales bacterium]